LSCRLPVGGNFMTYLELLVYTVVNLPFREWDLLTGSNERKEYLRDKLCIQASYRRRKSHILSYWSTPSSAYSPGNGIC
jgi:hypothetical protein